MLKKIPNPHDINSSENVDWWKTTYHSTDEESSKPEMFNHQIAFDGTKPIVIKQITKDKDSVYSPMFFSSAYKQR